MKKVKVKVRALRQLDPRILHRYLIIAQVHQAHNILRAEALRKAGR